MVKVLNVDLYDQDIPTAVQTILADIGSNDSRNNKLISATGAHGIVTAQKNVQFRNVLSDFYYNLPDGMPGVWIGRLKGAKNMQRCYGPDFFVETITRSSNKNIKHFFCGGKEGVADELKLACQEKFNNQNIAGTFCPPFRTLSEAEFIDLGKMIDQVGSNIVWIGISTPKQEYFAHELRKYCSVNYIVTVGAAFDFHTDNAKHTPKWIAKIGMEWFYRMGQEPKRLIKRYAEVVPLFIYYNLREFLTTKQTS